MNNSESKVEISLEEIAPDLRASLGERGYLAWANSLTEALQSALAVTDSEKVSFKIQRTPLQQGSKKSGEAVLVIGAVVMVLSTAAGYVIDPVKTTKLMQAIWSALKKVLPRDASVTVSIEKKVSRGQTVQEKKLLTVNAKDPEVAQSLLEAGLAVSESFQGKTDCSMKSTVTLTPRKP